MSDSTQRWQRLLDAGIVRGAAPPGAPLRTSWAITAVMGVAAWIAAAMILFFTFLTLDAVLKDAGVALAVGLVVVGACCGVLRKAGDRLFVTQLAIALSLAGQVLAGAGLFQLDVDASAAKWLIFAVFEAVLVVLVAQPAHRVLATLGVSAATMMALHEAGRAALVLPLVLGAFVAVYARILDGSSRFALWSGVGTGLALALLATMAAWTVLDVLLLSGSAEHVHSQRIASAALLIAACIAAAVVLLRDAGVRETSRIGLAGIGAAALVASIGAYAIPAVPAALVMLLSAFAAGRHVVMVLALTALIAALAFHYYQLDATLLQKSAALGALGVVLLGVRALVVRRRAAEAADA